MTFEWVTFRYADAVILTRVEIDLSAGTICAITGTNGAGKTTLAYLLLGLYRAQSGLIRIDGMPLDQLDIDCVRSQIVSFRRSRCCSPGTVWENITYGFSDALPEAVAEAVRCAAAHDVVAKLPFGYETIVGERGVTLWGASASAWRSRAPFSTVRRSSFSMSRPTIWTLIPSRSSSRKSGRSISGRQSF